MKLYKYKNYEEYKTAQTNGNKSKINKIWVLEEELIVIADYIKNNIPEASIGLCHGVRNGFEVKFFKEKLKIKIIGTEISETANQFEDVIQWDFHETKPEWISNIDFIYSNALDHSYKPEICVDVWMKCLSKKGKCFIHYAKAHNGKSDITDPFKASFDEYQEMISKKYKIENVIAINTINKKSNIFVVTNQ